MAFDGLGTFESAMSLAIGHLSGERGMTQEQITEHMRPKDSERLTKWGDMLVALGLDPSLVNKPKIKGAFDILGFLAHVECQYNQHHGDHTFLLTQVKKERARVIKAARTAAGQPNVETKQAAEAVLALADA